MGNGTAKLIELKNIDFGYSGGHKVLNNLDFVLKKGDKIGLAAPNGSGKTTFFHVIMGLLKPTAGLIFLFGNEMKSEKDFSKIRHRIGLLFQDADDQLFSPTVLEDVAFGPLNMGMSKDEAIEISKKTLKYLGLDGFENRITFKLSGGEKRLVSLATILSMDPDVLLLDEPTSGLDEKTKNHLKTVLCELDISYVLISHEFDFLSETTNAIYAMDDGKINMDEILHIHSHRHAHKVGRLPHKHV